MRESVVQPTRAELWNMIHAERRALADDLAGLDGAQWETPSLCGHWTVEEVLAHLTAAASTNGFRWFLSVLAARFDIDVHNDRRLAEHRGTEPAETLERFCAAVPRTTAASGHTPAWLGEVVVHAQDIRRPLGIATTASTEAWTAVARFYVSRDFTVPGRTRAAGLHLDATDGPFRHGDGALVRGTAEALTMTLAGRLAYCDELEGPGVAVLHDRIAAEKE